jgi:hypothetical protein
MGLEGHSAVQGAKGYLMGLMCKVAMVAVTIVGAVGWVRPATFFLLMAGLILVSYMVEYWEND